MPTIRPAEHTAPTLAHLRDSFTHTTELHVLDGHAGVAQTLNQYRGKVNPLKHDFYVRIDDDWLAPRHWQDTIAQAFEDISMLGMASIDLSGDFHPDAAKCMKHAQIPKQDGRVPYREILAPHNLAGGCHVLPAPLRLELGDMPIVSGTTYQVYGSLWLSHQVRRIGYRTAFIQCEESARLVQYPDSEAMQQKRAQDTQTYLKNQHEIVEQM